MKCRFDMREEFSSFNSPIGGIRQLPKRLRPETALLKIQGTHMRGKIVVSLTIAVLLAISVAPAGATRMERQNARHACRELVNVKHPELKGEARKAEIAKCDSDAEAYNK